MRESTRSRNHSLIVALGLGGGVIASHWKPGGYPRADLIAFLKDKYLPAVAAFRATLGPNERDRTIFLCMDNCRTHVSAQVQEAVLAGGVQVVYIPPYSPVLNPCELVFSEIKRRLRHDPTSDLDMRAEMPRRCEILHRRVMDGVSNVPTCNVDGYYRCCGWNDALPSGNQ